MNRIALKPVNIPLPRNVDPDVRRAVQRAEEAMRENNALVENILNSFIGAIGSISEETSGTEVIVGTQTAATGAWTGETRQPELFNGMHILYYLPYAGSGAATLNLKLSTGSWTGAKNIYRYATTALTTHYSAGSVIGMTFLSDRNAWVVDADYSVSAIYTTGYCVTAKGTAAKTASMTYFALHENEWVPVNFRYANTKAAALTLDINNTGAKPLYINGTVSSASNYAFPAGSYLVFYDGTNYYLRTDGKLPQAIP